MSKAVGLFVFTRIDGELVAICQRRGDYDYAKGQKETWAGLLQPTCHGKLREGESYEDALWREAEEELGDTFFLSDENLMTLVDGEIRTYGFMLQASVIGDMRLQPVTGGLVRITRRQADGMQPPKSEFRANGVPPGAPPVMFEDQIQALRKGFEVFA